MNQRKALIIVGTDTDAGKTMVAAALLKQYAALNDSLYYWKPVQTGYPTDDDVTTVRTLSGCSRLIRGFCFAEPASPHRAAESEGKTIHADDIVEAFASMQQEQHDLIVEGAGGLFVPLNRSTLWIEVLPRLQAPVLLVARTTLGTINHTLLSVEALQRRNISVAGIAFFGPSGPLAEDNVRTLADFTGLPCFGPMQYEDFATQKELDSRQDLKSLLCH